MLRKIVFGLLVAFSFLSFSSECLANKNLIITEEQLTSFDQNLDDLQKLIEASQLTTNASAQRIVSLEKNSQLLLQRLKKSSELQVTSAAIITKQAETLAQQEKLLKNFEILVAKLERKIQRMEQNNTTRLYGNTTSIGIVQTHQKMALSIGQKYGGGLEVGGEIVLVTW